MVIVVITCGYQLHSNDLKLGGWMSLQRETRKLLDPVTNLVEGEIPVLVHRKTHLRDEWVFAHKKGYLRLAKEGLRGTDFEVLMVYLGLLNFKNYVQLSQQDIADYLGIPKQNVYRSTKTLVEKKILLEGEKVGRNKTYRLNSFFGWKGEIGEEYYKAYYEDSMYLDNDDIS